MSTTGREPRRFVGAVSGPTLVVETEGSSSAAPDSEAFSAHYRAAVNEMAPTIQAFTTRDLEILGKHNWGWARANFLEYLRESEIRYVNAYRLLRPHLNPEARILDVGGFFAAFPLALRKCGFQVTVAEHYAYYGGVLDPIVTLLKSSGVAILDADFCATTVDVSSSFDAVLCMAVAEHLASSPERLMRNVHRALTPSGNLVFEVPNQLAWVNRVQMLRGRSFMPTLETIWNSAIPFTGHHHEYTLEDVVALMRLSSFEIKRLEFLDAYYGFSSAKSKLLYRLVPRIAPSTRDTLMVLAAPFESA